MPSTSTQDAPAPRVGDGRISIRGVSRRFGDVQALHPIELEIASGAITGLLGPNGSGKSTLLRILTGLLRPDAGTAFLDGVELQGDGTAVRRRCTYSPGELSLYNEMRGGEHLEWFLRGRGADAVRRGRELADRLALPLRKFVRGYSHGMKRQLLVAAALAPDVPVRILDEPTEGLDPSKRAAVLELLDADVATGTTVLLSSHHLGEVDRSCESIVFLDGGKVLSVESPEEIARRARRRLTLEFSSPDDAARATEILSGPLVEGIAARGSSLVAQLADEDPRPVLELLARARTLEPPRRIGYGELSLEELYETLYGVEGV